MRKIEGKFRKSTWKELKMRRKNVKAELVEGLVDRVIQ